MERVFSLFMVAVSASWAQEIPIDIARSTITIHTSKAGLFSAAGHEHWIAAPIASGSIDEAALRVVFTVESARLTVKPDAKVSAKDQAQIQKDMEQMTLETAKYPEISFRSSRIEKTGEEWKVEGLLALHGTTKPVTMYVKRSGEAYTGRTILKQTDFGIKPISVAGGTIKVKNEIDVEFQIFTKR